MATARRTKSNYVDQYVGERIADRRILLGMDQTQLAKLVGMTHNQVSRYEHAINRIPTGRLLDFAKALNVPIGYFLEGIVDVPPRETLTHEQMLVEMVRHFGEISEDLQVAFCALMRIVAVK